MSMLSILRQASNLPATATQEDAIAALTDALSAPEPHRVDLSDVVAAMATALGEARPLPDSPGDRFHQLAELTVKAGRVSTLSEAYSLVSAENSAMWEQARATQPQGR
jgi:hypothetical protein